MNYSDRLSQIDSNAVNERMATVHDRRQLSINRRTKSDTVYVVINPWDYTHAEVIGVFYTLESAKAVIANLKANGDDSGNACPNVFYEAIGIE